MSAKSTPAVNAMKQAGAAHRLLEYDYDPDADAIGMAAAAALGVDPAMLFKTLVSDVEGVGLVCAVIPAPARLDLKALAAAAGGKRAQLAEPKVAERTSGYVIGGISPLGMKKKLPTFIDASAEALPEMIVNGGRRGLQIAAAPVDIARVLGAKLVAITVAGRP
ncbi:Cys-tRNA(Pro) deacylase [Niveispirillum sp. SYP-B3756]|uniref:Cys-tRNA(Pro) deacylase n=1 Tax=Niveispirillum sp. SYP-B3756 TaxID=2662178 RepID=UPI0012929643|nr:Cys-tRNA(Pro) deacylase [Niveispirillum sp. SYP-B3756]MQP66342.1 Cys-tRNA(Pro) deacylase [Niveispirillum sp. SYP-B3756]